MYKELKHIQKLLWQSDDLMNQDTLYELQDYVAELTLKIAQQEKKTDDLMEHFKWLYKTE